MKRAVRLIALFLMVACLVSCLLACGNSKKSKPNTNLGNNDWENDNSGIPLPEPTDFGTNGEPYAYKALIRTGDTSVTEEQQHSIGNNGYAAIDFWSDTSDAQSKDIIAYAVYKRNSQIEANFNVRIQQLSQEGDMTQQLRLFYMNDTRIDLTVILAKAAANAATQNLLSNLNMMSTLDLTHPSYDQKSIKELALGDCLYYLSGDMNVSTMEVCGPTVVNLELYEKYMDTFVELLETDQAYSIYDLVLGKKWTIDTMLKMATEINVDENDSDRKLLGSQPGDVLGYFAYEGMGVYYFYGSGGRLTEIDEDGNHVLTIKKYNDLFDYLFNKFNVNEDNGGWLPHGLSGTRWSIFSSGRCLFTEMTLFDIRTELYSKRPFQYGILPNPTYEEGGDYHSVVYFTNCNHLWALPNKMNNSEIAQQMMNIFAAYSNVNLKDSTMDAYYNRTLYFTAASDAGSREVMNIIKDSMVYDIALLYDWDKMGTVTLGELTKNEEGLYAKNVTNQDSINKALQDTVEKLKNPQMNQ